MLEITYTSNENTATVKIVGRIDSANASQFDLKVAEAGTKERLVLDMTGLEYISSAGLRVILKYRKKNVDLEIINTSPEVYDIFDMTGFTDMMNIKRAYRSVSVEGCEIIGQGANGKVYRIDPDTVVKVYLKPDSLTAIEHERDVAKKALVLGIPTAISYDVVKVGERFASMFELLNASSFSNLLAEHPKDIDKYAFMYVNLLKQIHNTEVPTGQLSDGNVYLLHWLNGIKEHLPQTTWNKLFALCNAIPHSNHLIHGDYHTNNVMLQNDEVILIDMDTLCVAHPVLEFGSMYNAYVGFYALNHNGIKDFLGFDYSTGIAFWKDAMRLYFDTNDEVILALREKQAETVGLIHLLDRTLRKGGDTAFIAYCKNELIRLADELEALAW